MHASHRQLISGATAVSCAVMQQRNADVAHGCTTQAKGFALRNGHMYAYRLIEALGLPVADGVVRVSLVHYNTPDEVQSLLAALHQTLGYNNKVPC